MNKYEEGKAKARQEAINWQANFEEKNYDYYELLLWENYFYNKAKKYGLVKEFKENSII